MRAPFPTGPTLFPPNALYRFAGGLSIRKVEQIGRTDGDHRAVAAAVPHPISIFGAAMPEGPPGAAPAHRYGPSENE